MSRFHKLGAALAYEQAGEEHIEDANALEGILAGLDEVSPTPPKPVNVSPHKGDETPSWGPAVSMDGSNDLSHFGSPPRSAAY